MKNSIKFALISGGIIILLLITDIIGFWGFIGLLFLIGIIAQIWYSNEKTKERKEQKKKLNNELSKIDNFTPTKRLVGPWGLIAIDDNTEQIAIKEKTGRIRKYPYSEILSCEIIEDGETTYKKSTSRTVSGAIVGGIIAGGAGAIIGGLSGKEKEKKEIKYLDFKIVFKDTTNPNFKIRFFDAWEETARTKKSIRITDSVFGPVFQKALNNLKNWKNIIEIIIDKVDSQSNNTNNLTISVSDELSKLNDLKEKGILTEKEFEQQKKKILE